MWQAANAPKTAEYTPGQVPPRFHQVSPRFHPGGNPGDAQQLVADFVPGFFSCQLIKRVTWRNSADHKVRTDNSLAGSPTARWLQVCRLQSQHLISPDFSKVTACKVVPTQAGGQVIQSWGGQPSTGSKGILLNEVNNMVALQYGCTTIWLYHNTVVQQHGCTTIWLYYNMVILQYGCKQY